MPPDERLLVDRLAPLSRRGFRVVAQAPVGGAWTATGADVAVTVSPVDAGMAASVTTTATLQLEPGGATLGLLVPALDPQPTEAGAASFRPDWRIEALEDPSGAPVTWAVAADDPDARYDARPDRRLVIVRWTTPGDTPRALRVTWTQRVPLGRTDLLATVVLASGTSTPVLPLLPLPAGDAGAVPWTGRITLPAPGSPGGALAVAGALAPGDAGVGGGEHRLHGETAGAAAIVVGRWEIDLDGPVTLLSDAPDPGRTSRIRPLDALIRAWSGLGMRRVALVALPPRFAPPAALAAEGLAGMVGSRWVEEPITRGVDDAMGRLPEMETVLAAEGLAAAAWTARAGADLEAQAWVEALARAFAVEQLSGVDAIEWRAWMQRCAGAVRGAEPGLSPASMAYTGFHDTSARCAGPLVVGPMLDDRVGAERARAVRSEALASGTLSLGSLRAALVSVAPDAGAWADRWWAGGHLAHVTVAADAPERTVDGWVVRGHVRVDHDLAGAPIELLMKGWEDERLVGVRPTGLDTPFAVTLPFRPRGMAVDPRRRLLATSGGWFGERPIPTR